MKNFLKKKKNENSDMFVKGIETFKIKIKIL